MEELKIQSDGVILSPNLPFESGGVLNPACVMKDGLTHMFYRAVNSEGISTVGYCILKDKEIVSRSETPVLSPEFDYEARGLEDPRIVCIEDVYYMTYTVYDGINARVAYATSSDLKNWEKRGVISAQFSYTEALKAFDPHCLDNKYFDFGEEYRHRVSDKVVLWEKDTFLFPRKINGKFAMLHRVMPGIQLVTFDRFEELQSQDFWKKKLAALCETIVLEPKFWFETMLIGGGAPAIETEHGWLLIYHAIEEGVRTYRAGAALLDLNDPLKVIGRLKEPLFAPTEEWERKGVVGNVVFPTSVIDEGERCVVYYGAADAHIGRKSFDEKALLDLLLSSK